MNIDKERIKNLLYEIKKEAKEIQLAETISLVLQHILAKKYGEPVKGYIDNLYPFFVFRNTLIHRYWIVDDKELLRNCRKGYKDFFIFIEEIEKLFLNKT